MQLVPQNGFICLKKVSLAYKVPFLMPSLISLSPKMPADSTFQLPGHATTSRNPKPPQRLVELLSRLGPLDLNRYPHMCILCTVTHYSRFEIQHHYFAQTTKMDALVYLYTYMSLYTHI